MPLKLANNCEEFEHICKQMLDVYKAKNSDYGDSFSTSCDEFGLIAGVVRMNDKMNRIKSLLKKPQQVNDESIKDTLLDLANYSIMSLIWLNKETYENT